MSGTSIGNATSLAAASLQPTDVIPIERPGVTTPYRTRLSSLSLVATGMINVKDYGAVGDGVTDDTAAIQAAIDAANALYGSYRNTIRVYFPYTPDGYLVTSVILKSGVCLYSPSSNQTNGAYLTSITPGWVIDTPATQIVHAGIDGVGVKGGGTPATNGIGGIRFQDIYWCWIKNNFISNVANQGVLVSAGNAGEFSKILIYGALMDRSRSAVAGAFEIYGTDHLLDFIEAGTSQQTEGTITDANLYCTGILAGLGSGFIRDCVAEFSDVGFYVSGYYNRFEGCRADHNYAHGWMIAASGVSNQYTGCTAHDNSLDTTNTYDGFHCVGTAGQSSIFTGCRALSVEITDHRYGFYDNTQSINNKSKYSNCDSRGHGTGIVYLSGYASSIFEIADAGGHGNNFPDNDTTPSVAERSTWDFANSSATTITNFDDGIDGQIIRVRDAAAPPNTTITHGTNIFTASGSDIICAANIVYSFQKRATKWYQL